MLLGEVSPFEESVGAEKVAVAVCQDRAYRFLLRGCPSTVSAAKVGVRGFLAYRR